MEVFDGAAMMTEPLSLEQRLRTAVMLHKAKAYQAAVTIHRGILIDHPEHAVAHNNLGISLSILGEHEEALSHYRAAVVIDPRYVDALSNVGACLWSTQHYDDAEAAFLAGLVAVPNSAMLLQNLAILYLQQGRYTEAWPIYEARFSVLGVDLGRSGPRWNGERLTGPLLLWAEQGLGDEVLHLSMLANALARTDQIWLACDERLHGLVHRSFPTVSLLPRWVKTVRGAAAQLPLGSLGALCRTGFEDFPDRLGHLRPDVERARLCRQQLGNPARVIGISWASTGSAFSNAKTARLADFAPVFDLPDTVVVDLQYGETLFERMTGDDRLVHIDTLNLRDDIDGLAAVIAACDHVVTVSNTTAHLAAALGRPTTVLVPAVIGNCWYWGAHSETTPWYPMAALERQKVGEPWAEVVKRAVLTI